MNKIDKEFNRNLEGILESTEDAIISKSLDGTIQSWNKGSEKMFGYTSKEMIGKNISLIIPAEFINDDKNNLSSISNNEIVDRYETTSIKKNGEELHVSLIVSNLKDSAGKITGFYQVIRDITSQKKSEAELIEAYKELAFKNEEKDKRAEELLIANKELAFQNSEKGKRANELLIANEELAFQNEEKHKRAEELLIANKELAFQNAEKEKRAAAFHIANNELLYQTDQKAKRADELMIANKELAFQNEEKHKRAEELIIANKELAFQNAEKEKRANELMIANKELAFQNEEKHKRAEELIIANKELAFQNEEKQKRAEELLNANKELDFLNKNQQALFASIVNSSDDAMMSKTLDGVITSWNYGAEKIFGYSADEIIGKNVLTLIPPQLQQEEVDIVKKIQSGETVDHYETMRIRKDGATFHASLTISPIRNFGGNIIGAAKVLMDITEQKEKERHLKLLESVITYTTDAVMITEAEPFDEPGHRIVFVNASFTKMTGYTSEEVIGKTPRILQGPKSDKATLKVFSEAIRKWQPCEITIINYKKNGEEFWINFSVSPVANEKGRFTHWISIERDVTEQKLVEIQLNELNHNLKKQAKELALSNTELEQFAYVASHDLQEPLRMITNFLTQLEKKYGDVIDDTGKKYIGFAVDGAKRMRQIILDLLEYSKVGRMEDEKQELDLNKLIDEIEILNRKTIEEKKAVFLIDELPKIHAYRSPMRQVFQNLISNALKYSNKDMPVQIRITVKELEHQWQFAVSDNGIGIEKEYFDKIFIIFQRLHTTEAYSGTGMGLAMVKKIIETQGGKIWVESEEARPSARAGTDGDDPVGRGKGSTFYFTIKK